LRSANATALMKMDTDSGRLKYILNVLDDKIIFLPEDECVRFYITQDLSYLSLSTRNALQAYGKCGSCGIVQIAFAECECGNCKDIVFSYGDWKKVEELLHKDLRRPINRQAASLRRDRRSLCLGYYENEDIVKIMEIQNYAC